MAKFCVVGGAGFIGSNIVETLLGQGHFVRVMDNFCSGKESNLDFTKGLGKDKFELMRGDIRDKFACDQATQGMDYVLLLAGLKSVPQSMNDPESYNEVNINGILFMLQACSKNHVKRLVFSSSSSVYGDSESFPQKETDFPQLISPYALSKLAGEYYCKIFAEFFNVETVCLRYFNVFGPKQALDDEYAVVIPKFIHCIMNDQPPPIFGDGKQSRDFTYVENVVNANILAATTPGLKYEVMNIANGKDNSILELVENLNKIMGKNIKPLFKDKRPGDIYRSCADITKIKAKTGFKTTVSFEEGLKRTVEYFRSKQTV